MKTLVESVQRKQKKIGFGETKCLVCGKTLWKNCATQKYHGPFKKKGSCAWIAYSKAWRKGYKKRYDANPKKYSILGKKWREGHPDYMKEYARKH